MFNFFEKNKASVFLSLSSLCVRPCVCVCRERGGSGGHSWKGMEQLFKWRNYNKYKTEQKLQNT